MKLKHSLTILGLAIAATSSSACDSGAKKAEEAKKAAEEKAKAEADKLKEEAEAKAKAEAAKALTAERDKLKDKIAKAVRGMDRKITYLKNKAEKLPAPAKKKADEALEKLETAKKAVTDLTAKLDEAKDMDAVKGLTKTVTENLSTAEKALSTYEDAVMKK